MRSSVKSSLGIHALLAASCLTLVPAISRPVSFAIFGVVFTSVIVWAWQEDVLTIAAHPTVLAGAVLVWFALTVGFVQSPSFDGFLRMGAFIALSGGVIFVLSNVFTVREVYQAITHIAVAIVLIGLPSVILGDIGPIDVWRSESFVGIPYYTPTSIFDNPNLLGAVAAMGAAGAGAEVLSIRDSLSRLPDSEGLVAEGLVAELFAGICLFGVVLSTGRGALLALLGGVCVLIMCYVFPRNVAALLIALGGIGFVGVISVSSGLISGPGMLRVVSMDERGIIWQGVIRAVGERPLFGWGPGAGQALLERFIEADTSNIRTAPHNSYVRMFFIGGITGGIGYLTLTLGALRSALEDATPHGAPVVAMIVVVSVIFTFNGATLFGLHPVSVIGAFSVGFAQLSSGRTQSIQIPEVLLSKNFRAAVNNSIIIDTARSFSANQFANRSRDD